MGKRTDRYNRKGNGRRYRSSIRGGWGKRPRRRLNWKSILVLVCAVVLAISLIQLIGYGISALRRANTNRELQNLHSAAQETPAPTPLAQPSEAPQETAAPMPERIPEPTPQADPAATKTPYGMIMPSAPQSGQQAGNARRVYQMVGTSSDYLTEMRALYWKNKDVIGWVNIPGVVDLPVVYRDNVYYLDHDFNGNTSNGGTLFLDALHPFKETTQHLVLHGHNMKDGSMFAHLTHYQSAAYTKEHGIINWSTMYRKETYEIFAVAVIATDYRSPRYVAYLGTSSFRTDEQFSQFLQQIRENSVYWKGVEVQPTDALLTLSTCLEDDRILVMGRRISP